MSEFEFENIKKRRPIWLHGLYLVGLMFSVWGGSHLLLNQSAYTQLATFKYDKLKASLLEPEVEVVEVLENTEVIKEVAVRPKATAKLEKVEPKRVSHFRNKDLKPKNQLKKMFSEMSVYPSDNRVVVPSIGKNVPLVEVPNHQNWNQLENFIQDGLRDGVVVHPVSHSPGSFGNFFVTGHSSYYAWDNGRFKDVFALLHEVELGQIVEVYWEGKKYSYKINEIEVVSPTKVEVLDQPSDKSVLTLMTCTPVGTNKNRLILVGDLIDIE